MPFELGGLCMWGFGGHSRATTVLDTTRHHQGYLFLWVGHQRSCVILEPPKLPSLSCILWPQIIRTEDPPTSREAEKSGRKGCSSWQRTKETLLKLWARCCFKGVPWQEFQGGCAWYSREKTYADREGDVFADHFAWIKGACRLHHLLGLSHRQQYGSKFSSLSWRKMEDNLNVLAIDVMGIWWNLPAFPRVRIPKLSGAVVQASGTAVKRGSEMSC